MLSPSLRQVAHALLTRPPLSYISASRRINQCSFVRLECVKHAASVHPEPGSNSLNIVSNRQISPPLKSYSELFFLASYFLYFVFKVLLTRFLVFFVVVLFSKTVSPSLPRRLDQYITLLLSCQPLFLNFFRFFWRIILIIRRNIRKLRFSWAFYRMSKRIIDRIRRFFAGNAIFASLCRGNIRADRRFTEKQRFFQSKPAAFASWRL